MQLGSQGIVRLLEHEREAIHAAEFKDLRRHADFSDVSIMGTIASTQYALDQLDTWVQPQQCPHPVRPRPGHDCTSSYVRFEPKGLALIVGTWNFPIPLIFKPLCSALAAGCPCIVKLSEVGPHTSELLRIKLSEYLDSSYVQAVYGGVEHSTALLREKFGVIFYTGSTTIGKVVARAAAEHLTPCILELGGKNPVFVTKTADTKSCAKKLVQRKFANVGQWCVSPDHVFLERGADVDSFRQELKKAVRDEFGKDIQHCSTYSRIVGKHHFDRIARLLSEDDHGGEVLVGGLSSADREDLFIPPTIVFNPRKNSSLRNEEIFGPVLPIIECESMDEALAVTHECGDPLAAYIFSTDEDEIQHITAGTRSGGLCINDCVIHMLNETLPFGGRDSSGFGSYHGLWGFKAFSHERAVMHYAR
jgi:acyl-CoA reductase-like NAD-dependent aldehyde dehydrogenase